MKVRIDDKIYSTGKKKTRFKRLFALAKNEIEYEKILNNPENYLLLSKKHYSTEYIKYLKYYILKKYARK